MYRYRQLPLAPLLLFIFILLTGACTGPKIQTRADTSRAPARLTDDAVIMPDGYVLPVKSWQAGGETSAVVLALHGFNDYSNAFEATARIFSGSAITSFAIDQRGFGKTAQRGIWAGEETMRSDLVTVVRLLCERYAGRPVFVLGESMGGGLILSAVRQLEDTCVRGLILSSPAVWGWHSMPWWQTVPLRMLAHIAPGATLTGEGLDIKPSDNVEMLRALGRDPLVIRETRIDTVYGLTSLMESALLASPALNKLPALILYGEHDEIIPPQAFCEMLAHLPEQRASRWRLALYAEGYHMLSRDLQGEVVIKDMVAWIRDRNAPLPSGEEVRADSARLLKLCEG